MNDGRCANLHLMKTFNSNEDKVSQMATLMTYCQLIHIPRLYILYVIHCTLYVIFSKIV